jgi:hypothetical protein
MLRIKRVRTSQKISCTIPLISPFMLSCEPVEQSKHGRISPFDCSTGSQLRANGCRAALSSLFVYRWTEP